MNPVLVLEKMLLIMEITRARYTYSMDKVLFGEDESPNAPSIRTAWEYFHTDTLPRREQRENNTFRKLEPGEKGGELYSVLWTPISELGDFGLGVGMYFSSLLLYAGIIFLCALFYTPAIAHYRSDNYNHPSHFSDVSLSGSAACAQTTVPLDTSYSTTTSVNIGCNISTAQGGAATFVVIVLVIFLCVISWYQSKEAARLDESEQTAQDYSICV
jgi:hypothetical protein